MAPRLARFLLVLRVRLCEDPGAIRQIDRSNTVEPIFRRSSCMRVLKGPTPGPSDLRYDGHRSTRKTPIAFLSSEYTQLGASSNPGVFLMICLRE